MNVLDAYANREAEEKARRKAMQYAQQKEREDIVAMMALPASRRLMARFLDTTGIDTTSYRDTPIAMGHASGWQDAARWWLEVIREHCPEREAQMRAEAKREAREGATDESDDDN